MIHSNLEIIGSLLNGPGRFIDPPPARPHDNPRRLISCHRNRANPACAGTPHAREPIGVVVRALSMRSGTRPSDTAMSLGRECALALGEDGTGKPLIDAVGPEPALPSTAMALRFGIAVVLVGAAAVAGCGGSDGTGPRSSVGVAEPPPRNNGLEPAPPNVAHRCSALAPARGVPVLCPTLLPKGRWVVRHRSLRGGPDEYLLDIETEPPGWGGAFHLLAGGRTGRFSLSTTPSGGWPRDTRLRRDLGLVGAKPLRPGQPAAQAKRVRPERLRRASVAGHDALLLRVRHYPDGGVHGGHLAVVWNVGGAGYTVTLHFAQDSGRDEHQRHAMLLEVAAGMRSPDSAESG